MKRFSYQIKNRILSFLRKLKSKKGKPLCYKCNRAAVSADHVPPKSIFLESRFNLQTVPSCKFHNTDQSENDEYLKNILTMHIQAGHKGTKAFQGSVIRSISRRKRHYTPLLHSARKIMVSGQILGKFKYDYRQFHGAISKIADGIYFLENHSPYSGNWFVYNLSGALETNNQTDIEQHLAVVEMAKVAPWREMPHFKNPDEFSAYKWQEDPKGPFSYLLKFYSGINIVVFSNFEKKQKL